MNDKSKAFFLRAQAVLPGGVNSPVRAFRAVGGNPLFIEKTNGSRVYDVDGNEYIDYVLSWGPMILGHNNPAVREAVLDAAQRGLSFGAPNEYEVKLAEKMVELTGCEMVRMVNSGTEAVMSALRLARAFTQRNKIIKFEGCYHGHTDSMLVKAGSGAMTFGQPDSPGVPDAVAADTLVAPYNNLEFVEDLFKNNDVACVIIEPVAANMGVVLPEEGYLNGLRKLCDEYGALLIFDEIITGFRLGKGGAQEYFNVKADIVTYGKIIGGGMPVGAYGGRKEIMSYVSPSGPVYQAGTLSGNPIAMAAGFAQLEQLDSDELYTHLGKMGEKLGAGLDNIAKELGMIACVTQVGSLVCQFFGIDSVKDYETARGADTALYAQYFQKMLASGVYLAPSQFEAMFISLAHSETDIDVTLEKAREALVGIRS